MLSPLRILKEGSSNVPALDLLPYNFLQETHRPILNHHRALLLNNPGAEPGELPGGPPLSLPLREPEAEPASARHLGGPQNLRESVD